MVKNEEEQRIAEKKRIEEMLTLAKPIGGFQDEFEASCTEFGPRISTGILTLDIALNGGLSNELYILGAETSTGKSAFLMSIAQRIAEAGTDVLYFALEMGKFEFVARGISAISFEANRKDKSKRKVNAGNVLHWTYDEQIKDFSKLAFSCYSDYAEKYFQRFGEHLFILEAGIGGWTVRDIANFAAAFKQKTGKPVAVFVDYLQIIRTDSSDRSQADRKTRMDVAVTTLKTLASQIGMPVVTISSVGRSAYGEKVGTSGFKESGDTEYTGGVLLGWNWVGVTNAKDKDARAKEIEECKTNGFRRMELEILKNRNAERHKSVQLTYYPAYNFFEAGWPKDDGKSSEDKPVVKR